MIKYHRCVEQLYEWRKCYFNEKGVLVWNKSQIFSFVKQLFSTSNLKILCWKSHVNSMVTSNHLQNDWKSIFCSFRMYIFRRNLRVSSSIWIILGFCSRHNHTKPMSYWNPQKQIHIFYSGDLFDPSKRVDRKCLRLALPFP